MKAAGSLRRPRSVRSFLPGVPAAAAFVTRSFGASHPMQIMD